MPPKYTKRNAHIIHQFISGKTQAWIASFHGISETRVRQVLFWNERNIRYVYERKQELRNLQDYVSEWRLIVEVPRKTLYEKM